MVAIWELYQDRQRASSCLVSLKVVAKIKVTLLNSHTVLLEKFPTIDNIICSFLQLQSKLPRARTQVAKQHLEVTMVCLNITFLKIMINTLLHWTSKYIYTTSRK